MKKELKKKLIWHHETRQDLFKDIIACLIVVYVGFLAYMLVDARINYVNALTDHVSSQIQVMHSSAQLVD